MAKKSAATKDKKTPGDAGVVAATRAPAPAEAEEESPLVMRIAIVAVTSYLAEKIWSNRKIVSEVWFSGEQTATESTMVTIFEYLGAMGLLFVAGIVIGFAMTKVARFLPKF